MRETDGKGLYPTNFIFARFLSKIKKYTEYQPDVAEPHEKRPLKDI